MNYYKILGVKQSATNAEIKSAYRRLARMRHPDVNRGSEKAAREFSLLSRAYRSLTDPHERAYHDAQLNQKSSSSILYSSNPHAQRAMNVRVQTHWDRVVNQLLERDRQDSLERQRAVFTTVSLFLSTFFVAMIKPPLWQVLSLVGRSVLIALFLIGIWHLATRLREYLEHYTYRPRLIQASIIQDEPLPEQKFTRLSAYAFLIGGFAASLGLGLFLGWHAQDFFADLTLLFRHRAQTAQAGGLGYSHTSLLVSNLLLCPPIAVLIIDTLHGVASRIDAG
ncbi:MAG: J domain-containing protein [Pyrinomonadaceae bacterium]